jgi:DNA-binding NarL/FixJ family response regulator
MPIQETARAGANGYVLKEAPVEQLLEAIDTVLQGKTYSSPGLPPLDNIKS